jgi:hypothetical protein
MRLRRYPGVKTRQKMASQPSQLDRNSTESGETRQKVGFWDFWGTTFTPGLHGTHGQHGVLNTGWKFLKLLLARVKYLPRVPDLQEISFRCGPFLQVTARVLHQVEFVQVTSPPYPPAGTKKRFLGAGVPAYHPRS